MAKQNIISTNWYPFNKLLVTEISGNIRPEEVILWEQSIYRQLEKIEDHSEFKIMVNLSGFHTVDPEVKMRVRAVVPLMLANFGWEVGYLNPLNESSGLQLKRTRGIKCLAAAHVYNDTEKMERYQNNFGRYNEHYFSDSEKSYAWIRKYAAQIFKNKEQADFKKKVIQSIVPV